MSKGLKSRLEIGELISRRCFDLDQILTETWRLGGAGSKMRRSDEDYYCSIFLEVAMIIIYIYHIISYINISYINISYINISYINISYIYIIYIYIVLYITGCICRYRYKYRYRYRYKRQRILFNFRGSPSGYGTIPVDTANIETFYCQVRLPKKTLLLSRDKE